MQSPQHTYADLKGFFAFDPTDDQDQLLRKLAVYLSIRRIQPEVMIVKGYAGTGKTTTISTLVSNLWKTEKKAVLLAPTGRAAKVIAVYSKRPAFTIHKKIYFPKKQTNGSVDFVLQPNKHRNTIFIVDEASMIPDGRQNQKMFESSSLLDDLISYVYSGHQCKLIFIGDTAQLPPVKLEMSPALQAETLELNYNKSVIEIEEPLLFLYLLFNVFLAWGLLLLREVPHRFFFNRYANLKIAQIWVVVAPLQVLRRRRECRLRQLRHPPATPCKHAV